jgi:hypothetical protein
MLFYDKYIFQYFTLDGILLTQSISIGVQIYAILSAFIIFFPFWVHH